MNKTEIVELLKEYKKKQGQLDLKKLEKREKEILLKHKKEESPDTKITPGYTEGGKTNQVSSKIENSIIKIETNIETLETEIKELTKEIEILEIEVEKVNVRLGSLTYLENKIITAYYIDEFSPEYIGNYIYYEVKHQTRSERTIQRIIENILKKLEKL